MSTHHWGGRGGGRREGKCRGGIRERKVRGRLGSERERGRGERGR